MNTIIRRQKNWKEPNNTIEKKHINLFIRKDING